jgi:hypothetical protein
LEGWYDVNIKSIPCKIWTKIVKNHHNWSFYKALYTIYPNFEWEPWKFIDQNMFNSENDEKEIEMRYIEWLSYHYSIDFFEKWYEINDKDIRWYPTYRNGKSLGQRLQYHYPNIEWKLWRFKCEEIGDNYWEHKENQRELFEYIRISILKLDDIFQWIIILHRNQNIDIPIHLKNHIDKIISTFYHGSYLLCLQSIYPEIDWSTSKEYSNYRSYFQWLYKILNLTSYDDWYNVSKEDVIRNGFPMEERESLYKYLSISYPEIEWLPWRFSRVPDGYWDYLENRIRFFLWICNELRIKSISDWYGIQEGELERRGGRYLMRKYYNSNIYRALIDLFPNVSWDEDRFNFREMFSWEEEDRRGEFFIHLGNLLRLQSPADWYELPKEEAERNGGETILSRYYGGCIMTALISLFPEMEWHPWRFRFAREDTLGDVQIQRKFFDWFKREKNINHPDGWYEVDKMDIEEMGGRNLLRKFHGDSLSLALESIYPEIEWHPWKFRCQNKKYLERMNYMEEYGSRILKSLEHKLGINNESEWHGKKKVTIGNTLEGRILLESHSNSMVGILNHHYPNFQWNPKNWKLESMGEMQRKIFGIWKEIAPNGMELEYNKYWRHGGGALSIIQFDIWIPYLNVALEYQGEQHYADYSILGEDRLEEQYKRDREKVSICRDMSIELMTIPFWWNRDPLILSALFKDMLPKNEKFE